MKATAIRGYIGETVLTVCVQYIYILTLHRNTLSSRVIRAIRAIRVIRVIM